MSIAEKLTTIAENEQRVYEAGVENGKTAEWNEMWDGLQSYGARTQYQQFCSFSIFIVDKDTTPRWDFRPKYDIKPQSAQGMFRGLNSTSTGGIMYSNLTNTDLTQWLEDLGVTLDTSNCVDAGTMFYNCLGIRRVPFLDLSKATSMANFLAYSTIKIIDGIKSSENTAWVSTTFAAGHNTLDHCIFSGVIAKSLNLSKTNLDHESLLSVLNTLKDLTGTGTTLTLTLGATLQAKLTDTEKAIATQKGWTLS